jgi:hypothetical protein
MILLSTVSLTLAPKSKSSMSMQGIGSEKQYYEDQTKQHVQYINQILKEQLCKCKK